jgi:arginine decarboxylase
MNTKYKDLIEQTFDFPQEEFHTENGNLLFHNIDLAQLV